MIKNIDLTIENDMDLIAFFDFKWTLEAISNIVDNAIKYTPHGGRVRISAADYEMFVKIDVEDNGIGISEQDFPKIFARFYRSQKVSDCQGVGVGDREFVSDIFNNAKSFFDKISYVYIGLVAVLAFSVKLFIHTEFDFEYVCTLVVILGINYYFSYYFAMAQRLLLRADQKIRIVQGIQSVTLVLNTFFCIVAMKLGAGIHTVKIINALIFLINPIEFRIYVRKHYSISDTLYDEKRNFPRKTDCIVHYIAFLFI